MFNNIGKFFNDNVDAYSEERLSRGDYYFLDFINSRNHRKASLLDIGGGSGRFAKLMVRSFNDMDVTVVDPSSELLNIINDERIVKIRGWLPEGIPINQHFDYIHITHVLHHITGDSIGETRELLKQSLAKVGEYLNDGGVFLLHDVYYESFLIPTLARTMIFNMLALHQMAGIKIPIGELKAGLRVFFFTRSELKTMLHGCGFKIVGYHEKPWPNILKKNVMALKDWGEMAFILQKGAPSG